MSEAQPIPGERIECVLGMLTLSSVASCSCDTKSPDPSFHAVTCLYRTLQEAYTLISELVGRNPGWLVPGIFDAPDTLPTPMTPFEPVQPLPMPEYHFQEFVLKPFEVSSEAGTFRDMPILDIPNITTPPGAESYYVDPTADDIKTRRARTGAGIGICERELVRERVISAIAALDGGPRDLPTIKDILTVLIKAQ